MDGTSSVEQSEDGRSVTRLPQIAPVKYTGKGLSTNFSKATIAEFNISPREKKLVQGKNIHKVDHIVQNKIQVASIYREYKQFKDVTEQELNRDEQRRKFETVLLNKNQLDLNHRVYN
jgi:hypothetical protein